MKPGRVSCNDCGIWIAPIDGPNWGAQIQAYGATQQEAEALRARILPSVQDRRKESVHRIYRQSPDNRIRALERRKS